MSRLINISLSLVLLLALLTSLFIGCNSTTGSTSLTITGTTTENTTTTTDSRQTFAEMAVKGEQNYSDCARCHGYNFVVASGKTTLSYYNNAKSLLNKINTMSGGYGQAGYEILSYLLLEHGWVSADTVFDPDALAELFLPRN